MKNHLPLKILATVFSVFLIVSVASAQTPSASPETPAETIETDQSLKLMAIPPRSDVINAAPGETKQISIRLRNLSATTQTISTTTKDFVIADDGKTPIAITEQEAAPLRWSLANWITIAPTTTTLQPNQTAQFNVVIQVPEDALPGGHYAMILHQPTTPTATQENNEEVGGGTESAVSPKVGTLVYVIIAGDVKEEAFVRNFQAPSWVELGPVEMTYEIENLSDIHITPQTKIEIKNFFGRTVETIAVESLNVFPYASRRFEATFDRIWGIGPYRALVTAAYGTEGKIATASLTFWMIPYKILLAVVVIVFSLIHCYSPPPAS